MRATMWRVVRVGGPLMAAAMLAGVAQAQTTFVANLTIGQEPTLNGPTTVAGAPRPTPLGFAVFQLNAAQTAMTMQVSVWNIDFTGTQTADINDNLTAAHIHAGANVPPATNGVVWGFFGAPFNDTNSGNAGPLWDCVAFVGSVGGSCSGTWDANEGNNTTLTAQLPNIFAGRSYINFHTTQNPGGEIRGALIATPEPSTYALLATGLGMIGFMARRRRA